MFPFSILERIDVGETRFARHQSIPHEHLSVSSNGSTWVKQKPQAHPGPRLNRPFSILERIDVGETPLARPRPSALTPPFSILERIDVGETGVGAMHRRHRRHLSVSSNGSTWVKRYSSNVAATRRPCTFSILERIDVGETEPGGARRGGAPVLSVSSNGSTWVKPEYGLDTIQAVLPFSILERIDVGETLERR